MVPFPPMKDYRENMQIILESLQLENNKLMCNLQFESYSYLDIPTHNNYMNISKLTFVWLMS